MHLCFECLRPGDKDELLRIVPQIDSDRRRLALHASLCDELMDEEKNSRSRFSCFSRAVWHSGCLVGHISARLVSQATAKRLREAFRVTAYEDVDLLGRMSDKALAFANQKGEGSVLVLNSLFWDERRFSKLGDLHFAQIALERMTRFFEGNYVSEFTSVVVKDFRFLVLPLEAAAGKNCSITEIGDRHFFMQLRGPWTSKGIYWNPPKRLLTARPDYSQIDFIEEQRRYEARILHEFCFDVDAAWEAGYLPTWRRSESPGVSPALREDLEVIKRKGRVQERFPAISRWRRALNIRGGKADQDQIREDLEKMPSLMTPSLKK